VALRQFKNVFLLNHPDIDAIKPNIQNFYCVCGSASCNEGTTILIDKRQHDCLFEFKKKTQMTTVAVEVN
jgi:hypothetical protein